MILFSQEILRTAELYSPFTTTEEDPMNNELVGGLMSNVSALDCDNEIFLLHDKQLQYWSWVIETPIRIGLISVTLLCPVYVPPQKDPCLGRRNVGSFLVWRPVIEPTKTALKIIVNDLLDGFKMIYESRERCNSSVPPLVIRYVLQAHNWKGIMQINYYYVYKNLSIIKLCKKTKRKLIEKAGKRK